MTEKPASITLKRTVTIKVIVTEKFRKLLVYELNQSISGLQNQMAQFDARIKRGQGSRDYQHQMMAERRRQEVRIEDIREKIEHSKKLELGSKFVQGAIEGSATVKKGDNLYEKMGGLEILIKDGIIQDFTVSNRFQASKDAS